MHQIFSLVHSIESEVSSKKIISQKPKHVMSNKTLLPLKVPGLLADSQQAIFYSYILSSWPFLT